MIIILREIRPFSGFKEEIPCEHFKDHAGEAPNVGGCVVFDAQDHLEVNLFGERQDFGPLENGIGGSGSRWQNGGESSRHSPNLRFLFARSRPISNLVHSNC